MPPRGFGADHSAPAPAALALDEEGRLLAMQVGWGQCLWLGALPRAGGPTCGWGQYLWLGALHTSGWACARQLLGIISQGIAGVLLCNWKWKFIMSR